MKHLSCKLFSKCYKIDVCDNCKWCFYLFFIVLFITNGEIKQIHEMKIIGCFIILNI